MGHISILLNKKRRAHRHKTESSSLVPLTSVREMSSVFEQMNETAEYVPSNLSCRFYEFISTSATASHVVVAHSR